MIIGRIDEGVSRLERSRVLLAAYAVLMLVQLAAPVSGAANGSTRSTQASCTPVNPADFPSVPSITNPYLPMAPGQSSVFGGTSNDRPSQNVIFITHKTKVIMGVTTLVANDTGTIKGKLTEMTFDYFAQDNSGSVWYFGENASQIKNGVVTGHAGSWIGGVNGAQPGIIMEANPKVGDSYCQENSVGVAQDQAIVLSVSKSLCVPYTCSHGNALLTKETSPLDPGVVEFKWYIPGAGEAKAMDIKGGDDASQLVAIIRP